MNRNGRLLLVFILLSAVGSGSVAVGEFVVAPNSTVKVFRVEGTPDSHIVLGEGGSVAIQDGGKTVWLNFANQARAEEYLARKISKGLPDAQVKSFDVPKSVLDDLRRSAVPEDMVKTFPNRPIISRDPFPDQYGLRPEQIQSLNNQIIPGSGKKGF